jgi:hypothetical protein
MRLYLVPALQLYALVLLLLSNLVAVAGSPTAKSPRPQAAATHVPPHSGQPKRQPEYIDWQNVPPLGPSSTINPTGVNP